MVQRINAERGAPAGRDYTGGGSAIDAVPSPLVMSAAAGKPVAEARELSPEERQARNVQAVKLGIMTPEEAGMDVEESGEYADLDSALAAGESVKRPEPDPQLTVMAARKASLVTASDVPMYGARSVRPTRARLIDFKKIEYIDLQRGVAVVDSFELDMPAADLRAIREHVLRLAVNYVTAQLTAALEEVMLDGLVETVQPMRGGEVAGRVPPREQDSTAGRSLSVVPAMSLGVPEAESSSTSGSDSGVREGSEQDSGGDSDSLGEPLST